MDITGDMRAMKTEMTRVNKQSKGIRLVTIVCLLLLCSARVWAVDADNDFMDDVWELSNGLDPVVQRRLRDSGSTSDSG